MTSPAWRTWSRFVRISKPYFASADSRRTALGLLVALFILLLTICGLNVGISYVGRLFHDRGSPTVRRIRSIYSR